MQQVTGGSMSKVRVYEVAKQLNLEPKAVVAMFQTMGIPEVRNHMSSVDADAVERIKRQIERQKTHDVVEERIRPTVVKRRAIAKPTDAAPSAPQIAAPPTSAKSVASVADRASNRSVPVIEDSRESARALSDDSAATAKPVAPTRVIVPATPRETLERTSVRELPEVPEDRGSTREVVAAAPSRPQVSEQVEAKIPMPVPSAPSLRDDEPLPEVVPVAPPSVAAAPVVEAAPPPAPEPPPAPVVAAPVEAPPVPSAPPPRAPQRTGIEVWGGRPGVPMPTPVNVTRTGIGGGSTGGMARRVQYDPRAGSGPGSQRPGARPMGPGGRPGGPMNRGAAGMRGGRPGFNVPKRTVANTAQEMSAHKKVIRIEENITLASMAQRMSLKATELLMKLLSMGMTNVHINTSLDADTAKILAGEFGWEVEDVAVSEEDNIAAARGDDTAPVDEDLVPRAPVVTVMGHVDHGKTSLLDKIRKANVAAGEAGGITQHIGAYKVQTQNGTIVFLDTPGHEAFTQMRARGASVTDIVILVVAADDGVMPQTKEAVNHAKAAKVPIIVAVNKCDKPGAEPDRARRELVELGLQPEEWGGDTIFVNVSAHTGENISTLLEMVALQAEVLDLKANPKKAASCTVIEALLDRGRGPVARVLVQDGTLHVGDFVLAGAGFGKVRAMVNEHGKQVHEAGPATPVEILGLSDVPSAGETLHAVKDAKKAQEIAESRKTKAAAKGKGDIKISLEELSKRIADAGQQELRVIVKGDVQGSVEAVSDSLKKLSGEKVRLSVIHSGVGAITEGDVHLAIAGKAIVIGFNVRPAGKAGALADENRIEIRIYSIIYQAIDDVKSAMEGLLPAHLVEKVTGKAELRQLFKIKGIAIAGSYVLEGVVKRNAFIRVVREGVVVHEGKLGALKRFKDDVKDVAEGFECGISLENFNDIKEGDILECYEMEEVKQKL
jgi:translation initiation factor IF-2